MPALPDNTWRLFERIRHATGIERFVLVGGTALALRLRHRLSEDLDFLTGEPLPRQAITDILNNLHGSGSREFTKIDNPHLKLEFAAEGRDAEDYAQDWRVDGVKLSFLTKRLHTEAAQKVLSKKLAWAPVEGIDCGRIRVASEACIFALKSQLVAERLTSRDLFDLKILIETGRYSFADLLSEAAALGANAEFVKERIALGKLQVNDPPVNTINGAVDIRPVRAWFLEQVNEYERRAAMAR